MPEYFRRTTVLCLLMLFVALNAAILPAQTPSAQDRADSVLSEPVMPDGTANDTTATTTPQVKAKLNLLELVWTARWLMAPIIVMSLFVVAVGIERSIALRRQNVLPHELVEHIRDLAASAGPIDAGQLQRRCLQHPSATARIVQTVLRHGTRPYAELEREVSQSSQREADQLYRNVRTLNLAAAVTPLIGLLGTVWGMIEAFFATANLPVGVNKAESLAQGIYTALVTTAGGLMVAIPAAILAHMFEGQIQKLFHEVHELVHNRLLPLAGRFQRRQRAPSEPPRVRQAVRAK